MAKNSKALTGYSSGFWGPENFPVKFILEGGFGFVMQPHLPSGMATWFTIEDSSVNIAKGWGAPFSLNGKPVNDGVGTIASTQPYGNLVRATVKTGATKFGMQRGLKLDKVASNTCEWASSDLKQYVSWKGHSNRYGPSFPSDSDITEGVHFVQGQTVMVGLVSQDGGVIRTVNWDGNDHDVNGRWGLPMVATRTSYRDEEYYWDGTTFEQIQQGVTPPDVDYVFSDKVYLNGSLICKAPIDDNRPAGKPCGQEGLVQGACIRNTPPDPVYYTTLGLTPPEKEDWVTVVTQEWWLEDATLCKVEVYTDRVYTMPLRLAKGVNPGVANEGVLVDLAGQIVGLNPGAAQDAVIEQYNAEYSKWRLVAQFETPKEPMPLTFELHQPFLSVDYAWQACIGESPSHCHWLFSSSGKKAMQRRSYDPLIEYDAGVRNANILRELVLTDDAIPAVTMGFVNATTIEDAALLHAVVASDDDNAAGKMLLAADYKGETAVFAYAEGTTDGYRGDTWVVDYKMILPWTISEELIGMWAAVADQKVMIVSALDLRYDFICYGMYNVFYGPFSIGDYITTYDDWVIESDGIPRQISETYTSSEQNSYYAEVAHDVREWCRVYNSHDFPFTSNGTSVAFLNPSTYVLTHEIHKRVGAEYEVDSSDWFTPPIQREIDSSGYSYSIPGRGRYTSRVVINGVYVGTLPTATYSYGPYFGETMYYGSVSLG